MILHKSDQGARGGEGKPRQSERKLKGKERRERILNRPIEERAHERPVH